LYNTDALIRLFGPIAKSMKDPARSLDAEESRPAIALTIAWMLTCMSTAAGVLVVMALRLLMLAFPAAGPGAHPLERTSGVLLFGALTTGLLCLLLTPLALIVRRTRPPRAVTFGAILIALAPLLLLVVLLLL
jgi:hypothetical protein